MKATLTVYEHSAVGFPKVVLKWFQDEHREWKDAYIVVKGIIMRDVRWAWKHPCPSVYPQDEMERFDDWVRRTYCDDASVQG